MTIFSFNAFSQNIVSFGTVQGSTLNKGLVGYWTMDGVDYNSSTNRITDKTPYSNHGTNYGATFTTDRNGEAEGAMSFDGVSDYISMGDIDSLDSGDLTISTWAKVNNTGVLIGKHYNNFELRLEGTYFGGYIGDSYGWTEINDGAVAHEAALSEWNHYTWLLSYSTDIIYFYTNGEYKGSFLVPEGMSHYTVSDALIFGRRNPGANAYFNGALDDVRIYNRILSELEIQSLYDSYEPKISAGSLNKGLVLDMPLTLKYTKDETSGSEIMTDKTPYSNDGQNYGATINEEGASFDGVDDSININNFNYPLSWNQPFSLSSWIYIPSSYSWNTSRMSNIIGRGNYAGSLGLVMGISNNYIMGWVRGDNGSTAASGLITRDNWHHTSMIWDGSIVSLYIDGELVSSSSALNPEGVPDVNIWQAAYPLAFSGSSGSRYEGQISNIFMYNRALSETEVKSLYDKGRNTASGMTIKPYGSVSGMAGLSCLDILNNNPSAINNDGVYWIDPDGTGAFQVYCDMTSDGGGWSLVYHGLCNSATDVTYTTGEEVQISSNIKFNQMRIDAVNWPYSITRTTTEEAIMKETFSGYYQWLHEQPSDPAPTISFHSASTGVQDVKFTSNGIMFGYGNSWRKIANPFYTQHHPSYMYLGAYSGYGINGATDWGYGNYNQHMLDTSPTESGLGLTPIESQEIKTWIR
jgi:hypothetical protein